MRLKTLGGLGLEGSDYRGLKPLLLLTYVSLEGSRSRRELADLFWNSAKNPRDSLSVAIRKLRYAAGAILGTDRERVWSRIRCDANELLDHIDARQHQAALDLYRGPFLAGLDLSLDPELEEWVFATREILADRVQRALLELAEQDVRAGRREAGGKRAAEAYHLRGTSEPGPDRLQHMFRLLVSAEHPLASDVRLHAEAVGLGLPTESAGSLPDSDRGSDGAVDHNLPKATTSFVGRERELTQIASLLADPDCRLLTLLGLGGSGKSRLALRAAREQLGSDNFADGIFLVELDATERPELLANTIATTFGLDQRIEEDPLQRIERYLGQRTVLVLLDNFEHLVGAATLPARLLRACPNLKLLITSRERLNLREEWVLTINGLATDPPTHPTEATATSDAVRLFADRAKRVRHDFALTQDLRPDVTEICRLVEGSPLAIELAAAWVKVLAPSDIAKEIVQNLEILSSATRNVDDRHRSIRASFEHSWRRLTTQEQIALRGLAVFRGGFRREAAAEVTGATLPTLSSLVDRSLLRASLDGRYDRHPLLYQFCREALAKNQDEVERLSARHADYYLELVRTWQREFGRVRHRDMLRTFDEERENIRVVWRWIVEGERADLLERYAAAISDAFVNRHLEAVELFASAAEHLQAIQPDKQAALGCLLIEQARHLAWLTRYQQATSLVERGLALLGRLSEPDYDENLVRAHWVEVFVGSRIGDFKRADTHLTLGTALADRLLEPRYRADYLVTQAYMEMRRKLRGLKENRRYFQDVADQLAELGALEQHTIHLGGVGWYLTEHADSARAQRHFRESLHGIEQLGNHWLEPYSLAGLGAVHYQQGDSTNARRNLLRALSVAEKRHDLYIMSTILAFLARVEIAASNGDEAETHLREGLLLASRIGNDARLLYCLIALADLLDARARTAQAVVLLRTVLNHPALESRGDAERLAERLERDGVHEATQIDTTAEEMVTSFLEGTLFTKEE